MARRDSEGDSKQGLVVSLVAFVILFVLTAVIAFMGYSDAANAYALLEAKKTELKAAREGENRERLRTGFFKIVISNSEDQRKALDKDADVIAYDVNKNQAAFKQTVEEEKKKLKWIKWEAGMERPEQSYVELLDKMENDLKNARIGQKGAEDRRKQAEEAFETDKKAMRDGREKAEKEMADLKNQFAAKLKKIDDDYLRVVKEFEDSIIGADKYTKEIEQLKKALNQREAQYQALVRDTDARVKNLEAKIPQIDIMAYDTAKGKIMQIDRGGSTAYINLGSADLARPGLTFSIFGVGQYKPSAERKGAVEVINVIGDHLSAVRITEVRTATRDPLLTGDLLYNPTWSPGVKQHVVVAGLIDLTGDGKDGTLEFVRNLEKQGVVVDAYLDIREMVVRKRGDGIGRQTNFLVLGDTPEFLQEGRVRDNDPRAELKTKINEEIAKLHETAVKLGVNVVPARRYMTLIGYQLPRVRASQADWNSFLMTTRPAGNGGQMIQPEKKEEKKD